MFQELVRRGLKVPIEAARKRTFSEFLSENWPDWRWDWPHIKYCSDVLQAQADGDVKNVMLLMPPQHGKSELEIRYILYRLSQEPIPVAHCAYNFDYARTLAVRTRIAANGMFDNQKIADAVDEWRLSRGGSYKAVGINTGLTGHPVRLAVIDDPLKDRKEADSAVRREDVWTWYTSVLSSRGSPIKCLVMTPWHEDDLRGRILNSSEAGDWTVVKLPALAEANDPLGRAEGEALCPDMKTREGLEAQRRLDPYGFEALYQCNPTPREGSFFRVSQFEIVKGAVGITRICRAWDIAATANGGDYTVGVKIGVNGEGKYFILHMVRGQWATDERNQIMRQTAAADGASVMQRVPIDPGAAGKDAALYFTRLLAGYSVVSERVSGSKATRADPYSSQVNAGNVAIVEGAWNSDFIEEHRTFSGTGDERDDVIDASADAFTQLQSGGWATDKNMLDWLKQRAAS